MIYGTLGAYALAPLPRRRGLALRPHFRHPKNKKMQGLSIFTPNAAVIRPPNVSLNPMRSGLNGILDVFTSFFSPNNMSDTLQNSRSDLMNAANSYLTGMQDQLHTLKTRAQAQNASPNADVRSRAISVSSKADALLATYDTLKMDSDVLMKQIDQMIANPPLTSPYVIDNVIPDISTLGTRTQAALQDNTNLILNTGIQVTALASRMSQFKKDVSGLGSDVSDLESLAQGKLSLSSLVAGVGSTTSTVVRDVAIVGAIGLAIWVLAPTLISRMRRA